MAEIRISDKTTELVENYIFNATANELIRIYQGTVPTDISDTATITSRTADILIEHTTFTYSGNAISTAFAPASASGVATWFSVYKQTLGYIVGTIGTTNASDLVLANTTISAGLQYRVTGLAFHLPSTITY